MDASTGLHRLTFRAGRWTLPRVWLSTASDRCAAVTAHRRSWTPGGSLGSSPGPETALDDRSVAGARGGGVSTGSMTQKRPVVAATLVQALSSCQFIQGEYPRKRCGGISDGLVVNRKSFLRVT